jgi:hypothetical protein
MQGIAALNQSDQVQPYTEQDFRRMAGAVGTIYERLKPDQKTALSGLAEEISALPFAKLKVFDQLLNFLEKNATRYKDVVAELIRQDAVDEGDMPEQYNPPVFATIHAMVRDALKKSTPEQGYAKGGSVSLKHSAARVKAAGRGEDKILAHITPSEAALLKARGGSGDTNPLTGLPEYGFMKSIGKFLGAAAPVIGGVLGSMVGMPFLGAVIGGGIGGLASGGGVKGALMGAAMGGIGSLAFGGLSNVLSGSGTFMEGVTGRLPSYLGGSGESFGGTLFGGGSSAMQTATNAKGQAGDLGDIQKTLPDVGTRTVTPGTGGAGPTVSAGSPSATAAKTSFLDDPMKWIGENKGQALMLGGGALLAANSMNEKKAAPSLIGSNKELTKEEREAKYPYTVFNPSNFTSNYIAPTTTTPQYAWQKGVYETPKFVNEGPRFVAAAKGGVADIRTGGHLKGPGTGTSDSIPAKLSDGEFVMTAKAVRGAGGGDRMKGAKKMYELMHRFERVA